MKSSLLLLCLVTVAKISAAHDMGTSIQPYGYIYVPGGEIVTETNKQRITAFWMKETEVTNKEYRIYLLKSGMKGEEIAALLPDSSVLVKQMWIYRYIDYFKADVFWDFPVVGLTMEQMQKYARWKSAQLNEKYPLSDYHFRLPTKAEWQYAASAGEGYQEKYPWHTERPTNTKGCYLMCYLNFEQRSNLYGDSANSTIVYRNEIDTALMSDEYERLIEHTKRLRKLKRRHVGKAMPMIGLPVFADAYFPNNYGLYNMAGNVAEMLATGEVIGGSYRTSEEYCTIFESKSYPFNASVPQSDIGFRLVCDYVKPTYD